jgi:hypothetical protein
MWREQATAIWARAALVWFQGQPAALFAWIAHTERAAFVEDHICGGSQSWFQGPKGKHFYVEPTIQANRQFLQSFDPPIPRISRHIVPEDLWGSGMNNPN